MVPSGKLGTGFGRGGRWRCGGGVWAARAEHAWPAM